ncbi:CDP-glycerol glycerophosphotransferase family protein [Staphylococcus saprophyticus]|nr:CDP-glycerol glycerophosphotransferase family protein [Staphylococcus saprophyticus]
MNINILGFNIFAKGGTSRSNINLIKSFLKKGHRVQYFNSQNYKNDEIISLIIHEGIENENFIVHKFDDLDTISVGDLLIITREEYFKYSKEVKRKNKDINIIGEVHGPLRYIDESLDLSLEYMDAIRVSTESIKKQFIELYNYHAVFSQYVNAEHIRLNEKPINTKRNFLIKARFEDDIKDISYVIKLVNYIVKNTEYKDIKLYIIGYGPSEVLYKNLVKYYNLQNNIYINQREPLNYIYISASPYETLGYSILETIANGNRALIYSGNDNVLKEIYTNYNGIEFMEKNIIKDSIILTSLLNNKYTRDKRNEDFKLLKEEFLNDEYSDNYLMNFENIKKKQDSTTIKISEKYKLNTNSKIQKLNNSKITYSNMKEKPFFNRIFKNKLLTKHLKKFYEYRKGKLYRKVLDDIEPNENKIFIESFHGSNFSGDPKYIALAIKKHYKGKEIFVSSKNSLVDMEIRNYGFIPVRFGSQKYIEIFRKCKYIFINGNSWDKVYKHKNQKFIQTWHGFPLKKMVNDLSNESEKEMQLSQFIPRMSKWDYLITSSTINTMLLESAFQLKSNNNLKILQYGAPRNEYLIEKNDENEQKRLQRKYLFTENNEKKYLLFCPTWRKDKRENLTKIDLTKLLDNLPENYDIIIKLHPNESGLRYKYNNIDKRIHCFYNEFVDIQELYILCEAMITDYSSTIFDFAHLNKPIFLLQEDSKMYQKDVGFYFNIFELGKFPVASLDEKKTGITN